MTDRDYSDYHRGPPDPPEHPPIRRRPGHFDRSDTLLSSGPSLADYARVKDACNEHGSALQRIASALDLMPGANVHTDCVPAIERLLAEIAALREQLGRFSPLRARGVVDADDNLDCWDVEPFELCHDHVAALNEKDPAAMWRVVDLFARDQAPNA